MKTNDDTKYRHLRFSELILFGAFLFYLALTVFFCVMIAVTEDMTPVPYIYGGATTVLVAAVTFFLNKEKVENALKIFKHFKIPFTADHILPKEINNELFDASTMPIDTSGAIDSTLTEAALNKIEGE